LDYPNHAAIHATQAFAEELRPRTTTKPSSCGGGGQGGDGGANHGLQAELVAARVEMVAARADLAAAPPADAVIHDDVDEDDDIDFLPYNDEEGEFVSVE
jgi:hypothetical protein